MDEDFEEIQPKFEEEDSLDGDIDMLDLDY